MKSSFEGLPVFSGTGKITNLSEVINTINQTNDLLQLEEDLAALSSSNLKPGDKSELTSAINGQIARLKSEMPTNKNTLDQIKVINPNLKALSIIETTKEMNQSKEFVDYLKHVSKSGTELIECRNSDMINLFIGDYMNEAIEYDAADIFNYFKKRNHKITFTPLGDNANNKEASKVKSFCKEQNSKYEPVVGTNSHGDRLYMVGAIVISFNKAKELVVLSGEEFLRKPDETEITAAHKLFVPRETITPKLTEVDIPKEEKPKVTRGAKKIRLDNAYLIGALVLISTTIQVGTLISFLMLISYQ